MLNLYEKIETLCNSKNISGYKLCKDIGMSPNVITELRKGRRTSISPNNLEKLAEYFDVPLGYFIDEERSSLSTIGQNIVSAAGSIRAARLTLRNLYIDDAGIDAMLYGGYVWTDNALAQIAAALGCSVDALKKETAPTVTDERDLEMLSLLSRLTPEQKDMLLLQIKGLLPPQE